MGFNHFLSLFTISLEAPFADQSHKKMNETLQLINGYVFYVLYNIISTTSIITPGVPLSYSICQHIRFKSRVVDEHSLAFPRSCSDLFIMFVHTMEMQDNHENQCAKVTLIIT